MMRFMPAFIFLSLVSLLAFFTFDPPELEETPAAPEVVAAAPAVVEAEGTPSFAPDGASPSAQASGDKSEGKEGTEDGEDLSFGPELPAEQVEGSEVDVTAEEGGDTNVEEVIPAEAPPAEPTGPVEGADGEVVPEEVPATSVPSEVIIEDPVLVLEETEQPDIVELLQQTAE